MDDDIDDGSELTGRALLLMQSEEYLNDGKLLDSAVCSLLVIARAAHRLDELGIEALVNVGDDNGDE